MLLVFKSLILKSVILLIALSISFILLVSTNPLTLKASTLLPKESAQKHFPIFKFPVYLNIIEGIALLFKLNMITFLSLFIMFQV